jgi:putative ABC transport system permease protein
MFYFKIGYRNLIKNIRRSVITMLPIIIGMIACLLTQGFFNWNMNELKEALIHKGIGHYQLFAVGFSKYGNDDPYRYLITDATPILKELRRIPEVKLATPRLVFKGILSSGAKATVVSGEAGIPENEVKLNSYGNLKVGAKLSAKMPAGLLVGDGVARKLSAKIGDTLTLMGNMKDGGINAVDLRLTGITQSGSADLDKLAAAAPLRVIQDLSDLDCQVQKIVILLQKTKDSARVLPKIQAIARRYHLEYQTWETLAEFYRSVKMMYDVVFEIIILIVLAIVTFAISNTVNMNLNDRIREIGTIRALGTRRIQVARIFMAESLLIGLLGGLIGLTGSYLFIGVIELIGGLPVTVHGSAGITLMHIFFRPGLTAVAICMALFSLIAMLAAVIPARKAAGIGITDALRWN